MVTETPAKVVITLYYREFYSSPKVTMTSLFAHLAEAGDVGLRGCG